METGELMRLERTAGMLKAMGHPMRLAMLERLRIEPWCVCELAADLGLNKSVASKHLSQLRDVGLLSVEKKGTQVVYSLIVPSIVEMSQYGYGVLANPDSQSSGFGV